MSAKAVAATAPPSPTGVRVNTAITYRAASAGAIPTNEPTSPGTGTPFAISRPVPVVPAPPGYPHAVPHRPPGPGLAAHLVVLVRGRRAGTAVDRDHRLQHGPQGGRVLGRDHPAGHRSLGLRNRAVGGDGLLHQVRLDE